MKEHAAMKSANRPNIILITTDQQRKDSLSCYGSPFVHTPQLDSLAAEGIRCERAYCTNSVCTPSRASLFSGQYVHRHGAWNVGMKIAPDTKLLPQVLVERGFRTHHIGKAHFQPYQPKAEQTRESTPDWDKIYPEFSGPYYGFETIEMSMGHTVGGVSGHYGTWVKERCGDGGAKFAQTRRSSVPFGGAAVDWELPAAYRQTEWAAERAVAFLQEYAAEQARIQVEEQAGEGRPFFLNIGFQDPHHPHALPPEWREDLDVERIPAPTFVEGELDDKPAFFRDVHEGSWSSKHPLHGAFPLAGQGRSGTHAGQIPLTDQLLGRAYYYRMVEGIDAACGRIFQTLDELGMGDNTIIVFTSDHGELLGDHGFWMKGPFHYEQLINIPLIIRWKGVLPAGEVQPGIVSLVDIAPTLLAMCGIELPADMEGKDLSAWLAGKGGSGRTRALVETVDDPHKIRVKTIVTERWKLSCYPGQAFGELVDLQQDPGELRNLWDDPAYRHIKAELYGDLLAELETSERRNERISYA
jgi:uncharacterized sulfatase